jgi:hypothetical protein
MFNPIGLLFSLRWAAIIGLVAIAATGFNRAAPASAAQLSTTSCRHSNQVSKGTAIGSQVDGDLVTICLSKSQLRLIKPKPAPLPTKPTPRASVKPSPTVAPKPKVVPIPVWRKPAPRKTAIPRPVSARPSPSRKSSGSDNRGVFRPRVDAVTAVPAMARVGESVTISSNQLTRLGRTRLLGTPVVVKFQPTSLQLDFGDSAGTSSSTTKLAVVHHYQSVGRYWVTLHVRYRVEYRAANGVWFRDPDLITLVAPQTMVEVSSGFQAKSKSKVVLVTPIR